MRGLIVQLSEQEVGGAKCDPVPAAPFSIHLWARLRGGRILRGGGGTQPHSDWVAPTHMHSVGGTHHAGASGRFGRDPHILQRASNVNKSVSGWPPPLRCRWYRRRAVPLVVLTTQPSSACSGGTTVRRSVGEGPIQRYRVSPTSGCHMGGTHCASELGLCWGYYRTLHHAWRPNQTTHSQGYWVATIAHGRLVVATRSSNNPGRW